MKEDEGRKEGRKVKSTVISRCPVVGTLREGRKEGGKEGGKEGRNNGKEGISMWGKKATDLKLYIYTLYIYTYIYIH